MFATDVSIPRSPPVNSFTSAVQRFANACTRGEFTSVPRSNLLDRFQKFLGRDLFVRAQPHRHLLEARAEPPLPLDLLAQAREVQLDEARKRRVGERGPDLRERETELPQHHDLLQPHDVVAVVEPVPRFGAVRRTQKPNPVVVVKRPDRDARPLRKLANFPHGDNLQPDVASGSSGILRAAVGAPSVRPRAAGRTLCAPTGRQAQKVF